MIGRDLARRLESWYVVLVALHSYVVGVLLMLATEWGAAFGGWGEGVEPLFFARQAGVFHLVVATGYLLEYFRHRSITLMLIAKCTAVVFLTLVWLINKEPWAVPLSAVADGVMALIAWYLHAASRSSSSKRSMI